MYNLHTSTGRTSSSRDCISVSEHDNYGFYRVFPIDDTDVAAMRLPVFMFVLLRACTDD